MIPYTYFEQTGLLKAYPGFLSPQTCTDLIRLMQTSPSEAAKVLREPLDGHKMRSTRDVLVPAVTQSHMTSQLQAKLPELNLHFGCQTEKIQLLQFLRYLPGDYFLPHQDWYADDKPEIAPRQISFVLFLNAPPAYAGGELVFYLPHKALGMSIGMVIQPEIGLLISFPPQTVHEVRKVLSGERFTVAGWFH
ncbi:MAG: 2OG-Fe(II) oxygenase [Candidatus Sericytochromatia bacterium]|nr:2OG-Fe(II) oxygenase [Candidatus Sericytochromatia bacterium]